MSHQFILRPHSLILLWLLVVKIIISILLKPSCLILKKILLEIHFLHKYFEAFLPNFFFIKTSNLRQKLLAGTDLSNIVNKLLSYHEKTIAFFVLKLLVFIQPSMFQKSISSQNPILLIVVYEAYMSKPLLYRLKKSRSFHT